MKTFVLAACCAVALVAHDSYIMPAKFVTESGTPLLVSIHNGDSFPVSEHATDPSRLAEVRLTDGSRVTDLRIMGRATHGLVKLTKGGSHYIAAYLHPRPLELPGPKFEAYLREEGLLHVIDARKRKNMMAAAGREIYTKYAKAYLVCDQPDKGYSVPVGHEIEFVPEADPRGLQAGSTLTVRVLFRGKPLPDAQVQKAWAAGAKPGHAVAGRTDRNGRLSVPIESDGKWRLHVVHMEPARDSSKADWESFWASLTFEVPSAVVSRR
jgi:uncharacterized GH25 family protein